MVSFLKDLGDQCTIFLNHFAFLPWPFQMSPGPPKVYMYGPAASPLGRSYAVDCSHWSELGSSQQADLVDEVLEVLRRNGFVVLEGMVPADEQLAMEEAAKQHFEKLPEGQIVPSAPGVRKS